MQERLSEGGCRFVIPRQAPTYTWTDLAVAWRLASSGADAFGMLTRWFQQTYGRKHVLYFNRAQTGMFRLLREVAASKEVVMPAYTCIVVPEAALWAKCRVRFADIDLRDLNMNLPELVTALTPETHAIIATHQFGIPCQIEEITQLAHERGFYVIEDAAPALGARWDGRLVGTWGNASFFSFEDTKVISAGGGGVALMDDSDLAGRLAVDGPQRSSSRDLAHASRCVRSKLQCTPSVYASGLRLFLRRNGWPTADRGGMSASPVHAAPRWTRFGASLALTQLPHLQRNLADRRRIAATFSGLLDGRVGIEVLHPDTRALPSWVRYPVRVGDKHRFWRHMTAQGIDLSWSFDYVCGANASSAHSESVRARHASGRSINLPLWVGMSNEVTEQVALASLDCIARAAVGSSGTPRAGITRPAACA